MLHPFNLYHDYEPINSEIRPSKVGELKEAYWNLFTAKHDFYGLQKEMWRFIVERNQLNT